MGFTLIELMIVIAIIGILAAIAVPQFSKYREKSMDSHAKAALRNLAVAQEHYYYYHSIYTADRGALSAVTGWTLTNDVILGILAANINSWSATARHQKSPSTFTYSSSEGGLR